MLIVIMCVRNEEYYLPTFMNHIRDYVDGFVVLDDGSTDNTIKILENDPKVLSIIKNKITNKLDWDEAENRKKVIYEAYKVSKEKDNTWVLCCDPDERFETRFLKKLRYLCEKGRENQTVYGLHFRELHNDIKHYRCDGIWNNKTKYILFPLKENMSFDQVYNHRHHINWFYDDLADHMSLTKYNLYHLKMIKLDDRMKRAKLYNDLDPNLEIQSIGYDYLYDDKNMSLKRLNIINQFDYKEVPEDLKTYKEKNS